MKTIDKKVEPKYFKDIINGLKCFELRKDEDNFQVGDYIVLREYKNGEYTGRYRTKRIIYILRNVPQYGLMDGYCIIGW